MFSKGRARATDAAFCLGDLPPIMTQIERNHAEYEFAYPAQPWHIAGVCPIFLPKLPGDRPWPMTLFPNCWPAVIG
jgi:hypothetical protein